MLKPFNNNLLLDVTGSNKGVVVAAGTSNFDDAPRGIIVALPNSFRVSEDE